MRYRGRASVWKGGEGDYAAFTVVYQGANSFATQFLAA